MITRLIAAIILVMLSSPVLGVDWVFMADLNGRYGSTTYHSRVGQAVTAITAIEPGMVSIAGDMVAGQKQSLTRDDLNAMWHGFHDTVTTPLEAAGIPLVVSPGNHDGSAMRGFEAEVAEFERQWRAREPAVPLLEGSQWPRRHAVLQDGILLISIDGTLPGALPRKERDFLDLMLTRHGHEADFRVVVSHLPMWPLAKGREREIIADGETLSLLHQHNVDVLVSGHHHVFYSGTDPDGLLHVGVPALGGNARTLVDASQRQQHGFVKLSFEPGSIRVSAFEAPGFKPLDDWSRLPRTMDGPLGPLVRTQVVHLADRREGGGP